jgi:GAF domain-containing protein
MSAELPFCKYSDGVKLLRRRRVPVVMSKCETYLPKLSAFYSRVSNIDQTLVACERTMFCRTTQKIARKGLMEISHALPTVTELERIVITGRLQERTSRQTDVRAENAAFRELAKLLAAESEEFLQRLVEVTLKLCDADTVGISVEQVNDQGDEIFRWVAMAGELKQLVGGTTPRNFSPCGVCVDQNQPLLMDHIDSVYPYFKEAPLPFVEALLLPWEVSGGPVGTLWIVAHSERRKFDREDVRLMNCLTAFASGGIRLKRMLQDSERKIAAAQVVSTVAHHINNPLQGVVLTLFYLKSKSDLSPDVRELISAADALLQRVMGLSEELIRNDCLGLSNQISRLKEPRTFEKQLGLG